MKIQVKRQFFVHVQNAKQHNCMKCNTNHNHWMFYKQFLLHQSTIQRKQNRPQTTVSNILRRRNCHGSHTLWLFQHHKIDLPLKESKIRFSLFCKKNKRSELFVFHVFTWFFPYFFFFTKQLISNWMEKKYIEKYCKQDWLKWKKYNESCLKNIIALHLLIYFPLFFAFLPRLCSAFYWQPNNFPTTFVHQKQNEKQVLFL